MNLPCQQVEVGDQRVAILCVWGTVAVRIDFDARLLGRRCSFAKREQRVRKEC